MGEAEREAQSKVNDDDDDDDNTSGNPWILDTPNNREVIRISNEEWKPLIVSENASLYSYRGQCWGCLTMLEGKLKSDNQLLEVECPRCGKVSHFNGHRQRRRHNSK